MQALFQRSSVRTSAKPVTRPSRPVRINSKVVGADEGSRDKNDVTSSLGSQFLWDESIKA